MQELLLSLLENIEENWLKTTFTNCLFNTNFKSIIETNFEGNLICYQGYFIQIYTDLHWFDRYCKAGVQLLPQRVVRKKFFSPWYENVCYSYPILLIDDRIIYCV